MLSLSPFQPSAGHTDGALATHFASTRAHVIRFEQPGAQDQLTETLVVHDVSNTSCIQTAK